MDSNTARLISQMDSGNTVANGFAIKEGQLSLLRHLAQREGRSASEIVRQAIKDYVFQNYLAAPSRHSRE